MGLTLVTEWRINWVPLVLAVAVAGWYLVMRRRVIAAGLAWVGMRTALFLSGLGLYLWCTNGFLNAYASTLFWVWAIQILALLLLIPLGSCPLRSWALRSCPSRPRSCSSGTSPICGPGTPSQMPVSVCCWSVSAA